MPNLLIGRPIVSAAYSPRCELNIKDRLLRSDERLDGEVFMPARYGSDLIVDLLKVLGIEYIALDPLSSRFLASI